MLPNFRETLQTIVVRNMEKEGDRRMMDWHGQERKIKQKRKYMEGKEVSNERAGKGQRESQ